MVTDEVPRASLELRWTDRQTGPHTVNTAVGGPSTRMFLDFVVDGVSLYELFTKLGFDVISCLAVCWTTESQLESVKRLTGEGEPDSHAGQCSLFVCPECGGRDCGVVTVKVSREPDTISWSDIAWERYEIEEIDGRSVMSPTYELLDVGPLTFDARQLHETLSHLPPNGE